MEYNNNEFGASRGWSVVTSAICCSDQLFFLLITRSRAKILQGFSFLSGQGLHDQSELREVIRMLMANILPQSIAGNFGVHRSTIYCQRHRLCETRKNNECLRWKNLQLPDPANWRTFTPTKASFAEIFVVIELSNGCFWLTKWVLIGLADYNSHVLIYQNATCCSYGCVSFFFYWV